MASRKTIPRAVQAEILKKSLRRCCLCFALHANAKVKEGQIAHLDDNPANNDLDNLAFLCTFHHARWHQKGTITKGFTIGEVKAHRAALYRAVEEGAVGTAIRVKGPAAAMFRTSNTGSGTVINAVGPVRVTGAQSRRSPVIAPPPGTIGADPVMRSYIDYLIGRYIDWRKKGADRDPRPFHPARLHARLKKKFGDRPAMLPVRRFDDVVLDLQGSIDKTIWGYGSNRRNYHSLAEHREKMMGVGGASAN